MERSYNLIAVVSKDFCNVSDETHARFRSRATVPVVTFVNGDGHCLSTVDAPCRGQPISHLVTASTTRTEARCCRPLSCQKRCQHFLFSIFLGESQDVPFLLHPREDNDNPRGVPAALPRVRPGETSAVSEFTVIASPVAALPGIVALKKRVSNAKGIPIRDTRRVSQKAGG